MRSPVGFAYRRVILETAHGASDPGALQAAAQFAHLLDLELHCLFVEDAAVLALADFPFAREIRLPSHEWGRLDTNRLEHELRQEAAQVRRRLQEATNALGVANVFEVLRGDPATCLLERSCITDIIAVDASAARSAHTFARVHAAALQGDAAVLLLPARRRHQMRSGAVVAVIGDAQDPGLPVAERIAGAAGSRMVVLVPAATEAVTALVEQISASGFGRDRFVVRPLPGLQAEDLMHALAAEAERLIVMTRGAEPASGIESASRIATLRHVAVLLIPPASHASGGGH